MLAEVSLLLGAFYAGGALSARRVRSLAEGPYPSPEQGQREVEELAVKHAHVARREEIGRSSEGRSIFALRLRAPTAREGDPARPRLLVTAQLHAIEFVASFVARALAARLAEGYGRDPVATRLLQRADVLVVPLANPDGAARVWRADGWGGLGAQRFTARAVDPDRNFPFVPRPSRGWSAASARPGSPFYRGPRPLSEPECEALARLARRERFCAAVNLNGFGGTVLLPEPESGGPAALPRTLAVFEGVFQSHQPRLGYRPLRRRPGSTLGQLAPFLLEAFGVPSVTVAVGRPGPRLLAPWRLARAFDWANPPDPEHWAENDAPALIFALAELLERSGGRPLPASRPELGATPEQERRS
jgi:hypothetical protein